MPIQESNTSQEHKRYIIWKTFDNKRRAFERFAERTFHNALRKQLKQYLDAVDKRQVIDFDLEGVITVEPMLDAYEKVYTKVMKTFGQESYNNLKESMQKEVGVDWDVLIAQWIAGNEILNPSDTTSKIVMVTNNTKKGVRASVQAALKEGTSIQQFAKELSRMPDFSLRRATLIGRTEIIAASNAGSVLGAQASGIPTRKVWLATQDDRTRDLHLAVDGQKVPNLETPFNVGGDAMQYPGDASLGAAPSNTINCRCTVIYEPYDIDF
jgi:uncharacterized protein with gpF-like domain